MSPKKKAKSLQLLHERLLLLTAFFLKSLLIRATQATKRLNLQKTLHKTSLKDRGVEDIVKETQKKEKMTQTRNLNVPRIGKEVVLANSRADSTTTQRWILKFSWSANKSSKKKSTLKIESLHLLKNATKFKEVATNKSRSSLMVRREAVTVEEVPRKGDVNHSLLSQKLGKEVREVATPTEGRVDLLREVVTTTILIERLRRRQRDTMTMMIGVCIRILLSGEVGGTDHMVVTLTSAHQITTTEENQDTQIENRTMDTTNIMTKAITRLCMTLSQEDEV